jgi:hypothetical protein
MTLLDIKTQGLLDLAWVSQCQCSLISISNVVFSVPPSVSARRDFFQKKCQKTWH